MIVTLHMFRVTYESIFKKTLGHANVNHELTDEIRLSVNVLYKSSLPKIVSYFFHVAFA